MKRFNELSDEMKKMAEYHIKTKLITDIWFNNYYFQDLIEDKDQLTIIKTQILLFITTFSMKLTSSSNSKINMDEFDPADSLIVISNMEEDMKAYPELNEAFQKTIQSDIDNVCILEKKENYISMLHLEQIQKNIKEGKKVNIKDLSISQSAQGNTVVKQNVEYENTYELSDSGTNVGLFALNKSDKILN